MRSVLGRRRRGWEEVARSVSSWRKLEGCWLNFCCGGGAHRVGPSRPRLGGVGALRFELEEGWLGEVLVRSVLGRRGRGWEEFWCRTVELFVSVCSVL